MIEVLKQALEALNEYVDVVVSVNDPNDWRTVADGGKPARDAITSLQQAIAELESQEPEACDGDFPEGFDKSLGIPAQALREANAALCEVTNNRMWDVPALAERMLLFCRNTHPPQRKPLTDGDFLDWYDSAIWGNEDFKQCCQIAFEAGWQFAHGIKGEA